MKGDSLYNTETTITFKHSENRDNIKYYLITLKYHIVKYFVNENNTNKIFFSITSLKLSTRNIYVCVYIYHLSILITTT